MPLDFLLVIPAVCEADRLPPYLKELATALSGANFESVIQIVDDGSPTDQQQRLLEKLPQDNFGSCRIIPPLLLPQNHGKGYAIIEGWRTAPEARFYCFVDADGAVPATEVLRLFTKAADSLSPTPACLWASRRPESGKTVQRMFFRHVLGRIFSRVMNTYFGTHIYDNQCGLKIIPQGCYEKIAPLLQESRFCFDIELLLAVQHAGSPVVEVPIDWHDVRGGRLHALRDGIAMLRRLPHIRARAKRWPKIAPAG